MILGLLSDTHGHAVRTARAVRALERLGATAFVHCGDIGGEAVLDELAGRRAWLVCGNTDYLDNALLRYAQNLGLTIAGAGPLRFEWTGRHFAVFHGHEATFRAVLDSLETSGELPAAFGPCDYLLHGHTHQMADRYLGPVRVINPGAVQRAVTHTVATLDITCDELRFWIVDEVAGELDPVQYLPEGHN